MKPRDPTRSSADLGQTLRALGAASDGTSWWPQVLTLGSSEHRDTLAALLQQEPGVQVHDRLRSQLQALVDTRLPREKLRGRDLDAAVDAHLGGRAEQEYGTWVYYPWSRRLLHLLPEEEYVELRLSRNRYKILPEEQARLSAVRLAVAGLSVGHATALTLAMEGVGGEFRLADFDELCLSNMNRIRTGVHNVGLKKAILCARDLSEINPYLKVVLYPDGVNEDNVDDFLDRGRLDILFEETDDLYMKFFLREKARAYRMPVLMETSDRGMIDVERFDREPDRPPFHGLVAVTNARDLRGLSTYDKMPYVLDIIGASTMSRELAASLVEIDETIKTWPQLGSAVALGGALNTDVGRRVLLDQLTGSGRFYVDLERIICDDAAGAATPATPEAVPARPAPPERPRPAGGAPLSAEEARTLVSYAVLAPSGGNCQPWRFVSRGAVIDVHHDVARSRSFLDFDHQAAYLAIGAACENLRLIAGEMGCSTELEAFPDPADPTFVGRLTLARATPRDGDLWRMIAQRCTNRRIGPRTPLTGAEDKALVDAASGAGARLQLLRTPDELDEIGRLIGSCDRVRLLHPVMHREMMDEVRWTAEEAARRRDGLDLPSLELSPTDQAGMFVVKDPERTEHLRRIGGGSALEKPSRRAVAGASAVGLLSVSGTEPGDFFRAGMAMEQLWLKATELHLAVQPMTVLPYLFARVLRGSGEGLSGRERAELEELRARYLRLFSLKVGEGEALLFRVAKAPPPSARSHRRAVEDVLSFA